MKQKINLIPIWLKLEVALIKKRVLLNMKNLNLAFDEIKQRLYNSNYPHISSEGLKLSSVVLPFYKTENGKSGILLTKRSDHLKSHAGQISFPGGKFDELDKTLLETALREWEEETN